MWSMKFWKDTAERVIRTMAQTLLALLGTQLVAVTSLDWVQMLLVAVTAGVVALLTAVVASGIGDTESASFMKGKP